MIGFIVDNAEFALWLAPTWVTAVALNKTAPPDCPKHAARHECLDDHPFHVARQNAMYCSFLGLFWPIWLALAVLWSFSKSVEVTQKIPVPTLKRPNTKNMLTAGDTEKLDQQLEQLRAETDAHIERLAQERKEREQPLEGKIVDPRKGPRRDR